MKTDNRDPTLCKAFVARAKYVLSGHPEIKHSWSIDEDEDQCILDMPKQSANGFNITVEVFPNEISVYADGPHLHFEEIKNVETAIEDVLGLIRDLLSPAMRVVEHQSNGKPYKWHLESFRNGQWQREDITGFLLYNYFGRKGKVIYQNHVLPSRI